MFVDIISDLHIDQWDTKLENKFPCGEVLHFPYKFENSKSKILIIAGDISDNLDLTIDYLDKLSKTTKYSKILFVDGNHEHVYAHPNLYSKKFIYEKIKKLNNKKIVFLPLQPFKINKTMIIGCNGWWDYNKKNQNEIIKNYSYFDGWMPHLNKEDAKDYIQNVLQTADDDYEFLNILINDYKKDDNIEKIIVVTHTLPSKYLLNKKKEIGTHLNHKLTDLLSQKKISHWIFGHTHDSFECKINNIHYICNPRGRPEDLNRKIYHLKTIEL